jgi:hypothetical protein
MESSMSACVIRRASLDLLLPRPDTIYTTMGLDEAIKVLELAATVAEAVPVLGTPVKAALEAASKIVDFAKVR